jgi:hypothetical protein
MTGEKNEAEPSGASGGSHGVECCDPDARQFQCVQCGATVYTCERQRAGRNGDFRCPAHPDGLEVDDDVWVCGEACFEEYEALRLERLAKKIRNSRLYGE